MPICMITAVVALKRAAAVPKLAGPWLPKPLRPSRILAEDWIGMVGYSSIRSWEFGSVGSLHWQDLFRERGRYEKKRACLFFILPP